MTPFPWSPQNDEECTRMNERSTRVTCRTVDGLRGACPGGPGSLTKSCGRKFFPCRNCQCMSSSQCSGWAHTGWRRRSDRGWP